jgi:hypothetical protein
MLITRSERGCRLSQTRTGQSQPRGLAGQCPQHAVTRPCRTLAASPRQLTVTTASWPGLKVSR